MRLASTVHWSSGSTHCLPQSLTALHQDSLAPGPVASPSLLHSPPYPAGTSEILRHPLLIPSPVAPPSYSFCLAQGTLITPPKHPPFLSLSRILFIQKVVPRHPKTDRPSSAFLSHHPVRMAFFPQARVPRGLPNPSRRTLHSSPTGQQLAGQNVCAYKHKHISAAPTALSKGLRLSLIPTGQAQVQHQGLQYPLQSYQQKREPKQAKTGLRLLGSKGQEEVCPQRGIQPV